MGGGGQSGKTTTINEAQPLIAPEVSPLIKSSVARFMEAQAGGPSMLSLLSPTPQNIPGQTGVEQFFSNMMLGLGSPGTQFDAAGNLAQPQGGSGTTSPAPQSLDAMNWATSPELLALNQIMQMTGGPIGSSPATQEGKAALERQYQQETLPSIQNQMQLAGLGNSGALGESLSRARGGVASATVPLLQQEMVDRMNAVNQLAGLGGTLAQRERSDISGALQTAGTPREIQTQQEQAKFLDQQRVQALIEQLVMGPLNIFGPSLIGQAGTTAQKFGTRGAGLLGSIAGGGAK